MVKSIATVAVLAFCFMSTNYIYRFDPLYITVSITLSPCLHCLLLHIHSDLIRKSWISQSFQRSDIKSIVGEKHTIASLKSALSYVSQLVATILGCTSPDGCFHALHDTVASTSQLGHERCEEFFFWSANFSDDHKFKRPSGKESNECD